MSERSEILLYDKFGTPSFEESPLAELVVLEPSMLTEVGGGTLDGYCGDGDLFCGNLINTGLCTNAACGQTFQDVGCFSNIGCVNP